MASILHNTTIVVDGKRMATIVEKGYVLVVRRLPRCSLADYLMILTWLNDLGYNAV